MWTFLNQERADDLALCDKLWISNSTLNLRMFRVAYLGITMNLSKSNQSNGINRLSKSNSKLNLRHPVVKIILKSLFIELILPQFHTLNLNRDTRPVRRTHYSPTLFRSTIDGQILGQGVSDNFRTSFWYESSTCCNIQIIKVKVAPHLRIFKTSADIYCEIREIIFHRDNHNRELIINEIRQNDAKCAQKDPRFTVYSQDWPIDDWAIAVRGSQRRIKLRSDAKDAHSSGSPSSHGFWFFYLV